MALTTPVFLQSSQGFFQFLDLPLQLLGNYGRPGMFTRFGGHLDLQAHIADGVGADGACEALKLMGQPGNTEYIKAFFVTLSVAKGLRLFND
jgi:hypothetical protein